MRFTSNPYVIRRMRKRIKSYVAKLEKKHGKPVPARHLTKIPLMSWLDRIWLILVSLGLLGLLWLFRDVWPFYLILCPASAFFMWKGFTGVTVSIDEESLEESGVADESINDLALAEKLTQITLTREASFLMIHAVLAIFLAILEVVAALLAALAAVAGG